MISIDVVMVGMIQLNLISKCVFIFSKYVYKFSFTESRRFAGHSKWQNIRHIKAEKDNERAELFRQLKYRMKTAVTEGGSAKPEENQRLARLIEQCKKSQMPAAVLNAFLEKLSAGKEKSQSATIEILGPGNCIMIVRLDTDNVVRAKMDICSKLKKFSNVKIIEGCSKSLFDHIGIITTDKKFDYDKAIEDGINVEADDIEEIKDENITYYKFKCHPNSISKIKSKLEGLGYTIVATEEDFIPHSVIKLNVDDVPVVKSLEQKLLQLDDVTQIHTNVDFTNPLATKF